MANNSNKNKCNVPHLRFPGFSGEWDSERLENLTVSIGDGLHSTPVYCEQGDYCFINGNNIINGKVSINEKTLRVTKEEAYKYNAALLKADTILMSINGTIGNVALYNGENIMLGKSACYINPSSRIVREYLFHILSSPRIQAYFQGELTGTTIKNLSLKTIRGSKVSIPSNEEQKKIARLFSLVDERIATQNKIIEKYESLIKGIAQYCIKESTSGSIYAKLGDICQITTGKLDANAQVDNGIYPFFTCAEQPFKIDNFAFDTEALLISGNGANLGYINYYKGKFNAYQRTYVLDLFSENIQYIKWALKVLLPKRIAIEKSSSNTPYIVLSTLTDLRLPIPCKSEQSFIANLMQSLERKLLNQIAQYDSYNYLKQYLLRQMFI